MFNLLIVNALQIKGKKNTWVNRAFADLAFTLVILVPPLGFELERNINLGKPKPNFYPLSACLSDFL